LVQVAPLFPPFLPAASYPFQGRAAARAFPRRQETPPFPPFRSRGLSPGKRCLLPPSTEDVKLLPLFFFSPFIRGLARRARLMRLFPPFFCARRAPFFSFPFFFFFPSLFRRTNLSPTRCSRLKKPFLPPLVKVTSGSAEARIFPFSPPLFQGPSLFPFSRPRPAKKVTPPPLSSLHGDPAVFFFLRGTARAGGWLAG